MRGCVYCVFACNQSANRDTLPVSADKNHLFVLTLYCMGVSVDSQHAAVVRVLVEAFRGAAG